VRITRIATRQFRNLSGVRLDFSPGVNVFVGPNGQGKTNILEAICYFKFARSFRTRRDSDLIAFHEPHAGVDSHVIYDAGDSEQFSFVVSRRSRRRIRVGHKELERSAALVGRYPCVLFGPHDLVVVSGEPSLRRRFVDSVGSMVDQTYLASARAYARVLKQRNAALRARRDEQTVGALSRQLAHAGGTLTMYRAKIIEVLAKALHTHASESEAPYDLNIEYESMAWRSAGEAAGARGATAQPTPAQLEEILLTRLCERADEERRRQTTLSGPHRDDLLLTLDGRDLRRFGSQGQRRLFAVLLRLAEMSALEECLGEQCVLLLDDVFAEFDTEITRRLQRFLGGGRQVFVTTPVALVWTGSATVFRVDNGVVERVEAGGEV